MRVLLMFLLVGCGSSTTVDPAPQGEEAAARQDIDVATLKERLTASDTVLIDVRTPAEYASGHVPGAVSAPLADLDPQAYSGTVHVICKSGGRSSRAADTLVASGVTAVNIKGGTQAWIAAGYPVEP